MLSTREFLARNWFFLGLLGVVLLGTLAPAVGLALKPWINVMVFCGMLLIGFRFESGALLASMRNFRAIAIGVLCGFICMPLLSYALASIFFTDDPEMFTGVILAGAVPTTQASSIIWTDMSGGNHALAMVLMAVANILGVFVSPGILSLSLGKSMEVPIAAMLQTLVCVILLPVLIGQLFRRRFPIVPPEVHRSSRVVSIVIIWATVLTALSSGDLFSLPLLRVLICVTLQYAIMAAISYWGSLASGLSKADAVAVMFCSAQVTMTFAAVVGFSYFTPRCIIYVVVYHLFQQFMGQVTAKYLGRSKEVTTHAR